MKTRSALVLSLVTACGGILGTACSDSSGGPPGTTGGTTASAGVAGMSAAGSSVAGTANSAGNGGSGGSATTEAAGTGGACDMPQVVVFPRSDTDQAWDDNDFSDVSIESTCPAVVTATWPHEMGWQNADPAEANHEKTRFTLDSTYQSDLTNKALTVSIELTEDMRGPTATDGGYLVSLVSVSTFDRVVTTGGSGAGGMAGTGGDIGVGAVGGTLGGVGGGGTGGVAGGGAGGVGGGTGGGGSAGLAGGGVGGATGGGVAGDTAGVAGTDATGGTTTITETGYAEAESPTMTLLRVGDKVTLTFALPKKGTAVDSYDPTRPIKINVRIYSRYEGVDTMGTAGAGGVGGVAGTGGASGGAAGGGSAGVAGGGEGGRGGAAGAGGVAGGGGASGTAVGGGAGMSGGGGAGSGGAAGDGAGGTGPMPIYAYLTSKFTITNFKVIDASTP